MRLTDAALLGFDFTGHSLIEASAGTGKTYTIANLYLKAVCEGQAVEEILVVTFTNAATDELRGRVRRRLLEALRELEHPRREDPFLTQLLDHFQAQQGQLRRSLQAAIQHMDEAAIFTIHGFCQRALSEFAFASGVAFEFDFVTDETELLHQVCADYWRQHFYPLPALLAQRILARWRDPAALLRTIRPLLGRELEVIGGATVEQGLEQRLEQLQALKDEIAQLWAREEGALEALFAEHQSALKANIYRADAWERIAEAMAQVLQSGDPLAQMPERLHWSKLTRSLKKGQSFPTHRLFDLVEAHAEQVEELSGRLEGYYRAHLRQALEQVDRAYQALKQERAILTADDLLRRLDQALAGPGGDALAQRLRRRFPLAMIDEFQDTDPLQYRIFRSLYPPQQQDAGLVMIGDPKQAIYGFRGADIHAYLEAKNATPEQRRFSLAMNWRSCAGLIQATNALFSAGGESPFLFEDLPFEPVQPCPKAIAALEINASNSAPLEFWRCDHWLEDDEEGTPTSREAQGQRLASLVAVHVRGLIAQGQAGLATLGEQPLRPSDIALLVRSHRQAEWLRAALAEEGISSAYVGDESVFDSEEARELQLLLQAVAHPSQRSAIVPIFSTRLMGHTLPQLEALLEQDTAWETWLGHLAELHELWLQRGFMPMFMELLERLSIATQLAQQPQGERRLTNLMQLGELLHKASLEHPGITRLLRWYQETLQQESGAEEARLRLESDAALVKILTIHKSKGLQFPVVYLPYLWMSYQGKQELPLYRDADRGWVLQLDPLPEAQQAEVDGQIARERLAEEMRLLYVALTRAEQKNIVLWGGMVDHYGHWQARHSALAQLLHGDVDGLEKGYPAAEAQARFAELAQASDANLVYVEPDLASQGAGPLADAPQPILQARPFARRGWGDWRISSYSALAGGSHNPIDHDPGADIETQEQPSGVFAFPKGVRAGSFLHALLEELDFQAPRSADNEQLVRRMQRRYGIEGHWLPLLMSWLEQIVTTPLNGAALTLQALAPEQRLAELDFFFRCGTLRAEALNRLLAQFDMGEQSPLHFRQLRGMLTGQIDLVFEYQGRFFIADYKSNYLGNHGAAYDAPALERAMQSRRYDLQYLIYSIALHRYLRGRLPDYDPAQHLGGVYYLFLRGMDGSGEHGIYHTRLSLELLQAVDALLGEGGG